MCTPFLHRAWFLNQSSHFFKHAGGAEGTCKALPNEAPCKHPRKHGLITRVYLHQTSLNCWFLFLFNGVLKLYHVSIHTVSNSVDLALFRPRLGFRGAPTLDPAQFLKTSPVCVYVCVSFTSSIMAGSRSIIQSKSSFAPSRFLRYSIIYFSYLCRWFPVLVLHRQRFRYCVFRSWWIWQLGWLEPAHGFLSTTRSITCFCSTSLLIWKCPLCHC